MLLLKKSTMTFALVTQWARDWRMSFKSDPQRQAVELRFSKKRLAMDHSVILFNNIPVKQVDEHKHLGFILNSKLSFQLILNLPSLKRERGSAC